jgi:hypothetical protein
MEFLMSEANEDKTSGDFREMGLRLAQEVISFLKKKMDRVSRSGFLRDIKLSFVGHSLGNIIIRTALAGNIINAMQCNAMSCHTFLLICNLTLALYLYCHREHNGTIPKIPSHICFYIWPTFGVSLQLKLFV